MKFALFSSLAAGALALPSSNVLERRQMGHGHDAPKNGATPQALSPLARPDLLPSLPVYKEEAFPPVSTRKGAIAKKIWYGPLTLKPADVKLVENRKANDTMDPAGNLFYFRVDKIPKGVGLLSTEVTVKNKAGKTLGIADGIYNHHIAMLDLTKPVEKLISCPGKGPISDLPAPVFAGVGEDRGRYVYDSGDAKIEAAYELKSTDIIIVTAEIINNKKENQDVYAVLELEYVPGKPKLPAYSHTLSVSQCEDGPGGYIHPKEGEKKFNRKSTVMTVQMDGYIFNVRGHLHDGGETIILKNNGALLCESKPKYGGEGKQAGSWATIGSMGECNPPVRVKKGDQLTIEAYYDFIAHPARKNAMGGMAEEMGLTIFSFAAL